MRATRTELAAIENNNLATRLRQVVSTTRTDNTASDNDNFATRHRGSSLRKPAHFVDGLLLQNIAKLV
jgi:hypothetical protein